MSLSIKSLQGDFLELSLTLRPDTHFLVGGLDNSTSVLCWDELMLQDSQNPDLEHFDFRLLRGFQSKMS